MTLSFRKFAATASLTGMLLLPVNSFASTEAHGIWGVGIQIGMLEYGASQNASPAFLVQSLTYARELAVASGCIPTNEIDSLLSAMRSTNSSRSLYPRITAYRQQLATYVLENCNCAGQSASRHTVSAYKTADWPNSSTDYARVGKDLVFDVGMGSNPKWGYGYASVEMSGVHKVSVDVLHAPSVYKHYDQNSFAGFVIDYHTRSGYTKRVMVSIGMYDRNRNHHTFIEGVAPKYVEYIDLGRNSRYNLDFNQWAPADWDGRICFSVGIQNAGENNSIKAKLNLPV